jgi:hypothetical protein
MSGLNQKTSKGINFLSSFLPLTNTFLEFFEGADEILFDLLLVTTFRNVEMGDAVREDRSKASPASSESEEDCWPRASPLSESEL